MKKVLVGGLLGGLTLFVWGAIAHMALPLGEAGLRAMPPALEDATVAAMKNAMHERALYFFPGRDMSHSPTALEQEAWAAKYAAGPAGIVAFTPVPPWGFGGQLGFEFLGNFLAALAAACVILHVPASVGYFKRALLVACFGLVMSFDVDLSYWNWYGFPTVYAIAQLVEHTVAWLLAGLVLSGVCRD